MSNFASFPDYPTFGPGGNGDWFRRDGMKSALQTPGWLASKGIDAFEYEATRGVNASEEALRALVRRRASITSAFLCTRPISFRSRVSIPKSA